MITYYFLFSIGLKYIIGLRNNKKSSNEYTCSWFEDFLYDISLCLICITLFTGIKEYFTGALDYTTYQFIFTIRTFHTITSQAILIKLIPYTILCHQLG